MVETTRTLSNFLYALFDVCYMQVCDSNRAIGDYIGIERSIGDVISVDCEHGSFEAEVREVPDDVPVEEYQTKEVISWGLDDEQGDVYALYAQVTELREMSVSYDVYAVHIPDAQGGGDEKELGEIQRIEVQE